MTPCFQDLVLKGRQEDDEEEEERTPFQVCKPKKQSKVVNNL